MAYLRTISRDQAGAIAILALLGVMAVSLSVITITSRLAISELQMARAGGVIDETYYAAETGLNEALYRLIANPVPGGYGFDFEGLAVDVQVGHNPSNPYQRIITATATHANGNKRAVRVTANTDSFAGGFDYAIQGGAGGVYLSNGSQINGDVYSNAGILPATGGSTGNVNGSVYAKYFNAAGTPNMVDKVNISGNAHAHTIARSDISGQARYFGAATISNTSVGGLACPNANCFPGSPDPGEKPLPLSETDINGWKDDITDHGGAALLPNPADCPPAYSSGYYCVSGNAVLGTKKIEGNFYMNIGASLALTGNLWVTGDIILNNNGTIQVDSGLGKGSVVIIADGIIDVNNNYTISGSGDPASFILMVSMSPSITPPAVYASNNSNSIVFAALNGRLRVKNNGALNAAAAHELWLENNAVVTYNPLLLAFSIPSGGGNEVGTALGTWEEL